IDARRAFQRRCKRQRELLVPSAQSLSSDLESRLTAHEHAGRRLNRVPGVFYLLEDGREKNGRLPGVARYGRGENDGPQAKGPALFACGLQGREVVSDNDVRSIFKERLVRLWRLG